MEVVFQTVHSRVSKPVLIVSEGPAGPAVNWGMKDPLVEHLANVIQQLNQQLGQIMAKDPELDYIVVNVD